MSTLTESATQNVNRFFGSQAALRGWTVALMVSNMLLIVTGGLVRLTGSGLGCSTWPECEPGSYTPHPAAGIHGAIEFGNRLLTFVLLVVALATVVAAFRALGPQDRNAMKFRALAIASALGIPLQGVIGGITVLSGLNPWVVGLHLLLSVALIAVAVALVLLAWRVEPASVSPLGRVLVVMVGVLTAVTIVVGTAVTGAGPHAGDGGAHRNGLTPSVITAIHSWSVWLLLAATVAALLVTGRRVLLVLLALQLIQGAIGYAQNASGLPVVLVALHLLGVSVIAAATSAVVLTLRLDRSVEHR